MHLKELFKYFMSSLLLLLCLACFTLIGYSLIDLLQDKSFTMDDLDVRDEYKVSIAGIYTANGVGDPIWAQSGGEKWLESGMILCDTGIKTFWLPEKFQFPEGINSGDSVKAVIVWIEEYDAWFLLEITPW